MVKNWVFFEVATATPAANAIPKADGSGDLADGWFPSNIVRTDDSRLSDDRDPTAHASDHQNGGSDEIATATPAANAIPKANASGNLDDWLSSDVVRDDDSRLTDSRDPNVHASDHIMGGGDAIDADQLEIDLDVTGITPDTTPAEVTNVKHLSAIIKGLINKVVALETALGNKVDTSLLSTTPTAGQIPLVMSDGYLSRDLLDLDMNNEDS